MIATLQDLRFALRQLNKHRGFAIVAILTLAIRVAAATAVFSLAICVLSSLLPALRAARLDPANTLRQQ